MVEYLVWFEQIYNIFEALKKMALVCVNNKKLFF